MKNKDIKELRRKVFIVKLLAGITLCGLMIGLILVELFLK